jgi:hypothetical protein
MKMSISEMEKKAKSAVNQWNNRYPIGQLVDIKKDDGSIVRTQTYAPASVVGSTAVCWFNGIRGAFMLERATPIIDKVQS